MKRVATFIVGLLAMCMVSYAASAQTSTNLKLPIFPLECSVDELQTGNGLLTQVTPENCIPPKPQPPLPGQLPELLLPITERVGPAAVQPSLVDETDLRPDLPLDSGYQSVPIHDKPALLQSRSFAVELYTALILLAFVGAGAFLTIRFVAQSGLVPVLLDRFWRKKKNY